jgi:hypothetical protein
MLFRANFWYTRGVEFSSYWRRYQLSKFSIATCSPPPCCPVTALRKDQKGSSCSCSDQLSVFSRSPVFSMPWPVPAFFSAWGRVPWLQPPSLPCLSEAVPLHVVFKQSVWQFPFSSGTFQVYGVQVNEAACRCLRRFLS